MSGFHLSMNLGIICWIRRCVFYPGNFQVCRLFVQEVLLICVCLDELEPEDFVPYIEFKSNQKSYQWIGAGRDSDSHLLALCSHWLDHREEMSPSSSMHASVTTTPAPEAEPESVEGDDCDDSEPQPIVSVIAVGEEPPPRWSTNWMVRPSTEEEKLEFQVNSGFR